MSQKYTTKCTRVVCLLGIYYFLRFSDINRQTIEQRQRIKKSHKLANSPYIIKFQEMFVSDSLLHIIMEYAPHGSLKDAANVSSSLLLYLSNCV